MTGKRGIINESNETYDYRVRVTVGVRCLFTTPNSMDSRSNAFYRNGPLGNSAGKPLSSLLS